jgi:hypothetical protein
LGLGDLSRLSLARLFALYQSLIILEQGVNLISESSADKSVFIGFSVHHTPTIGLPRAARPKKVFSQRAAHGVIGRVDESWTNLTRLAGGDGSATAVSTLRREGRYIR